MVLGRRHGLARVGGHCAVRGGCDGPVDGRVPEPDEDHNGSHRRCVNGSYLWTRGYNRCLTLPQRPLHLERYLPNECYGPR